MLNKGIDHIKQSKHAPVLIALLLGLLFVLFLPPLIPPHTALYTTREIPPNYMEAYYAEAPREDSIRSVAFVRKSLSSIGIDYNDRELIPGFTSQDYMGHYNLLSAPKPNWVYATDFDYDGSKEMVYISYENDTNMLYVFRAKNSEILRAVALPAVGEIFYARTRYFQRVGDELLYISLATKSPGSKTNTTLLSYNFKTDKVEVLLQFPKLMQSYMMKGYEDKLLFIDNFSPKVFEFYIYNLQKVDVESFKRKKQMKVIVKSAQTVTQIYPYNITSDNLFLFDVNKRLNLINLDSLFCARTLFLDPLPFNEKTHKMRLEYSEDGVIFYTIREKEKDYKLFKYNVKTKRLFRIKHKGGASVGDILFYGDIDGNGVNDIVFTDERHGEESICVQQEGSYYDVLRYPVAREKLKISNVVLMGDKLVFDSKGIQHWIRNYSKNPLYNLRWLIYLGIIAFSWFLGFVVQQVRENRAYRRQEANNRILQLQLENVQKRIDPHFIFNSLNNLGALILEGETNESYDYLSKVSGVLNKALRNRNILISIEEELNFCTSVLDAQRQRFKDKFDYEVYIDQEIDLSCKMPSNILNSMVDNCIKHGFAGIDYLGHISIELLQREKGFLIVVEDNGKGRKAAQADKDQSKSTGTGLEICEQYVRLLNTGRKAPLLSFTITDLWQEDASPRGTRCEYFVPNDLT